MSALNGRSLGFSAPKGIRCIVTYAVRAVETGEMLCYDVSVPRRALGALLPHFTLDRNEPGKMYRVSVPRRALGALLRGGWTDATYAGLTD
jgi:hypothetical protein